MADHSAHIEINGHMVPVEKADLFFHGSTGEPLTDAEWDEQKARLEADNIGLVPEEFR